MEDERCVNPVIDSNDVRYESEGTVDESLKKK